LESRCSLRVRYVDIVVSIEVAVKVTPPDFTCGEQ
jgi:hypothetical protein